MKLERVFDLRVKIERVVIMAKAKSLKDKVIEYFGEIKCYEEEKQLIVVLPDGLLLEDTDLDDKDLTLTMTIEDLSAVKFVSEITVSSDISSVIVLLSKDAKGLEK